MRETKKAEFSGGVCYEAVFEDGKLDGISVSVKKKSALLSEKDASSLASWLLTMIGQPVGEVIRAKIQPPAARPVDAPAPDMSERRAVRTRGPIVQEEEPADESLEGVKFDQEPSVPAGKKPNVVLGVPARAET